MNYIVYSHRLTARQTLRAAYRNKTQNNNTTTNTFRDKYALSLAQLSCSVLRHTAQLDKRRNYAILVFASSVWPHFEIGRRTKRTTAQHRQPRRDISRKNALHQRKHNQSAYAPAGRHHAGHAPHAHTATQSAIRSAHVAAAQRHQNAYDLHASGLSQCGGNDSRHCRATGRHLGDWLSGQRGGCRARVDRAIAAAIGRLRGQRDRAN